MILQIPPNRRFQPTASLAALASRRLKREPLGGIAQKGDPDETEESVVQGWHLVALFVAFARIGGVRGDFKYSGYTNVYSYADAYGNINPYSYADAYGNINPYSYTYS